MGAIGEQDATQERMITTTLPPWMLMWSGSELGLERLRVRLAAYVYGNILVLAAIVIATGKSIVGGEAALLVAVTTITTYAAHIIAHDVGQQLGRERNAHRPHMRHEIADATPILMSGLVPAMVLFVATLSIVPTQAAQIAAAVWVITRLAFVGFLIERVNGRRATWRTLSGGLGLAVLSAAVVVLKVLYAH